MPELVSFDYAIVRLVPRVDREEFINVGVILFCRAQRLLEARIKLDVARLATLAPQLDAALVQSQIDLLPRICAGGASAGALGDLTQTERFLWLISPRSTAIQISPAHAGLCEDPKAELDRLFKEMVES
jgi:hypothetical protein